MIALDYLYYRILKLLKMMSLKNSFYHSRAVFFFSFVTALNVFTIVSWTGIAVLPNKYPFMLLAVLWFILWFRVFVAPKRYKGILQKFDNEPAIHAIIGGLATLVYIVVSFVVFVRFMG